MVPKGLAALANQLRRACQWSCMSLVFLQSPSTYTLSPVEHESSTETSGANSWRRTVIGPYSAGCCFWWSTFELLVEAQRRCGVLSNSFRTEFLALAARDLDCSRWGRGGCP